MKYFLNIQFSFAFAFNANIVILHIIHIVFITFFIILPSLYLVHNQKSIYLIGNRFVSYRIERVIQIRLLENSYLCSKTNIPLSNQTIINLRLHRDILTRSKNEKMKKIIFHFYLTFFFFFNTIAMDNHFRFRYCV